MYNAAWWRLSRQLQTKLRIIHNRLVRTTFTIIGHFNTPLHCVKIFVTPSVLKQKWFFLLSANYKILILLSFSTYQFVGRSECQTVRQMMADSTNLPGSPSSRASRADNVRTVPGEVHACKPSYYSIFTVRIRY